VVETANAIQMARPARPAEPGRASHPAPLQPLLRRWEAVPGLSERDRGLIGALPVSLREVRAGHDIGREGDRSSQCCLVVKGVVCRYRVTPSGKRQILSFHLPGELVDLQGLLLGAMDHSVAALTRGEVGLIPHHALRHLCAEAPRVVDALWRETLIDAAIGREWTVGLGRRTARARIAHLLCEFVIRSQAAGLAEGRSCEFPISQSELGDASGLSNVHVNRVLQDLRGAGLVALSGSHLAVLDWPGLARAGEFDPAYLHLPE
jgi:CRP-like cAMP-binding protein